MNFKNKYNLEERKNESSKMLLKYPSRIPIIVEKYEKCDLSTMDKNKYLVPKDLLLSQFINIIRKRIELDSSQALFITINNRLCSSSSLISDIYNDNKDEDNFLYVVYTSENTFG